MSDMYLRFVSATTPHIGASHSDTTNVTYSMPACRRCSVTICSMNICTCIHVNICILHTLYTDVFYITVCILTCLCHITHATLYVYAWILVALIPLACLYTCTHSIHVMLLLPLQIYSRHSRAPPYHCFLGSHSHQITKSRLDFFFFFYFDFSVEPDEGFASHHCGVMDRRYSSSKMRAEWASWRAVSAYRESVLIHTASRAALEYFQRAVRVQGGGTFVPPRASKMRC